MLLEKWLNNEAEETGWVNARISYTLFLRSKRTYIKFKSKTKFKKITQQVMNIWFIINNKRLPIFNRQSFIIYNLIYGVILIVVVVRFAGDTPEIDGEYDALTVIVDGVKVTYPITNFILDEYIPVGLVV